MEVVTFNIPPPPLPAQVQTVDRKDQASDLNFKSFYQSNSSMGDSLLFKKAANYIEKNEGKKYKPYQDKYGNWTVGIGHLMSPEEIQKYADKTLSDSEVQALFDKDLTSKIKLVRSMFGSVFETYSDDLKIAILDGFFRGDLSGSPKTIALLKAKKFKEASEEYLNNREYRNSLASKDHRGVAYRMQRNAKIMAAER